MMNHDAAHCSDFTEDCPVECYRAVLCRDVKESKLYNIPLAWASLKGTRECRLANEKTTNDVEHMDTEDLREIFSIRLNGILRERGIRQVWLADRINVDQVTISSYIRKSKLPSALNIAKIADALGVSSDYLLGLSDDRGDS